MASGDPQGKIEKKRERRGEGREKEGGLIRAVLKRGENGSRGEKRRKV